MQHARKRAAATAEEQRVGAILEESRHQADVSDVGLAAGEHAALAYPAFLVVPRAGGRFLQDANFTVGTLEAGKDAHADSPCRPHANA